MQAIKASFPRRCARSNTRGSNGRRLSARGAIWLPEDAEDDPVPAVLEYIPYRNRTGPPSATPPPSLARRPRLRRRPRRHARKRRLRRRAPQRVPAAGAGRRVEVHRVARRATVVHGRARDLREVVGRVQRAPDRGPAAAGAEGDRDRRARPTTATPTTSTTWAAACSERHALLGLDDARDERAPPGPGRRGRALARPVARAARATPPFVEDWLSHQHRDGYWKHGSVCEDFAAITAPSRGRRLGGRVHERRLPRCSPGSRARARAWSGRGATRTRTRRARGPRSASSRSACAGGTTGSRGGDTGVMDEPMLRVWMQDWVEPRPFYVERPGRWVAERVALAPDRAASLRARRGRHRRHPAKGRAPPRGVQTCGLEAGAWCPSGVVRRQPPDQRREDGLSLTFTSAPLDEQLEVLGFPEATLALAADRASGAPRDPAVRRCPGRLVAPRQPRPLNLTHRESHEHPAPIEPGRRTASPCG